MRSPRGLAIVLVLLLLAAGCGTGRRQEAQTRTTVRVENGNFLDMNIYLVDGAQRIRLGTVPGLSTRVLPIPSNRLFGITTLRFLADPIGGRATSVSHEIQVVPGDEVTLEIRP